MENYHNVTKYHDILIIQPNTSILQCMNGMTVTLEYLTALLEQIDLFQSQIPELHPNRSMALCIPVILVSLRIFVSYVQLVT